MDFVLQYFQSCGPQFKTSISRHRIVIFNWSRMTMSRMKKVWWIFPELWPLIQISASTIQKVHRQIYLGLCIVVTPANTDMGCNISRVMTFGRKPYLGHYVLNPMTERRFWCDYSSQDDDVSTQKLAYVIPYFQRESSSLYSLETFSRRGHKCHQNLK